MDGLLLGVWAVVFKESTCPKLKVVFLTREVRKRGIGDMGSIAIPYFILSAVVSRESYDIAEIIFLGRGFALFLGMALQA